MRILSFNANGLRSAASKGFFDWFAPRDVDVLCVQETKAQEHQLTDAAFRPAGYKAWFKDASTKKGYSGVAIYSRREPDEVRTSLAGRRSPTKAAISKRASATSAWSVSTSRPAAPANCARVSRKR